MEEVKPFLRAVLNASPGLPQHKICREYKDLTGDELPYHQLGYATVYDLLKALEGIFSLFYDQC